MIEKKIFRDKSKYHHTKDEVEYIFWAHHAKINSSIVSAGKMKRFINFSKGCMLMVVREKDAKTSEAFQGCDPTHKKELYEIVSNYNGIF